MIKGNADKTLEGVFIIFVQYFERHCQTAFLHHVVTNCGFQKLVRDNRNCLLRGKAHT